jgi:hypothetical protein
VAEVSSCLRAAPTLPSHLLVANTDAMHHTIRLLIVLSKEVLSAVREKCLIDLKQSFFVIYEEI